MAHILILGDNGHGRKNYFEAAADRVNAEGHDCVVLDNAQELANRLSTSSYPKPDLLVMDFNWSDATPGVLYETLGRDGAQALPVLVISSGFMYGSTKTQLENYHNVKGYIPTVCQMTPALPKIISAFLDNPEDEDFQATIQRIEKSDGSLSKDRGYVLEAIAKDHRHGLLDADAERLEA